MPFNNLPWCFNRAVYEEGSHDAKMKLGSRGIRTRRLSPKTSALDHSATLPDIKAQAILTSLNYFRAELVVLVDLYQGEIKYTTRY